LIKGVFFLSYFGRVEPQSFPKVVKRPNLGKKSRGAPKQSELDVDFKFITKKLQKSS
jgi:hypothetical protein